MTQRQEDNEQNPKQMLLHLARTFYLEAYAVKRALLTEINCLSCMACSLMRHVVMLTVMMVKWKGLG